MIIYLQYRLRGVPPEKREFPPLLAGIIDSTIIFLVLTYLPEVIL